MKLDTIYFNYIKNRVKLYETRVYDKKRQKVKLLDIVKFTDKGSNNIFEAKITELSYFKDFKEAILDTGLKKLLPNARTINQGIKMYESFPHSEGTFKEGAKKFGVLRMKFMIL